MRKEYDFNRGVRGKYAKEYKEGTDLVRRKIKMPTIEMINQVNQVIYFRLADWQKAEQALEFLQNRLHEFSLNEIIIKLIAVNTLYSTRVPAREILRIAEHIAEMNFAPDSVDPKLVEQMALVGGNHCRRSIVSKYIHFFVQDVPIWDTYVRMMVSHYLQRRNNFATYQNYVTAFDEFKLYINYNGTNHCLDRYLWLAGLYKEWQEKGADAEINSEVKEFFNDPSNQHIIAVAFD